MKLNAIPLIGIFLISTAFICTANENKGHVCFRVLDSNRDGMVTFQEFKQAYGDDKEKFNMADENEDGKLTHDEYHDLLGHGS